MAKLLHWLHLRVSFGKRCKSFDYNCPVCYQYAWYDYLQCDGADPDTRKNETEV